MGSFILNIQKNVAYNMLISRQQIKIKHLLSGYKKESCNKLRETVRYSVRKKSYPFRLNFPCALNESASIFRHLLQEFVTICVKNDLTRVVLQAI